MPVPKISLSLYMFIYKLVVCINKIKTSGSAFFDTYDWKPCHLISTHACDYLLSAYPVTGSAFQDSGWKGWGEISYGGYECLKRARAAEFLV